MSRSLPDPNQTSIALGAQLFLTHFLMGGVAVWLWQGMGGFDVWGRLVVALTGAGLVGWLLSLNLQRSLRGLDWALVQLVTMQPVTGLSLRGHYPLTGLVAKVGEVAERERPFQEMRQRHLQQAGEAAAQAERNRLARDLHDSIKQQLFSIQISAATAQARWENDSDGAQTALADVRYSSKAALVEMNALLHQLAPDPLEKVGLVQAIEEQAAALGYRSGAEVTVQIGDLPTDAQFPLGAQTDLFRIVQELLSNIARHARASNVQFSILHSPFSIQKELVVEIVDDGQGFDPDMVAGGMGLANVQERVDKLNGRLAVKSQSGKGTTVTIQIPLADHDDMKEQLMQKPDHAFNRLGLIGLGGGIALAAILYYPLYVVLPGRYVAGWPSGSAPIGWILVGVALLLTAVVGYLAARQARPASRREAAWWGFAGGGIAAATTYLGFAGAAASVVGNGVIFEHGLTPAVDGDAFLWLMAETTNNIIWWSFGGLWVALLLGVLLGAVGGRCVRSQPDGAMADRRNRHWVRVSVSGAAFLAALLSLILSVSIFNLLGEQIVATANDLSPAVASEYTLSLPAAGAGLLPITTTFIFYLLSLGWVYQSIKAARVASGENHQMIWTVLLAGYFAIFATIILPLLLVAILSVLDGVVLVGMGINLVFTLLLLREMYLVEQTLPAIPTQLASGYGRWLLPVIAVAAGLALWLSTVRFLESLSWGLVLVLFIVVGLMHRQKATGTIPAGWGNLFTYTAVLAILLIYLFIALDWLETTAVMMALLVILALIPRRQFAAVRTKPQRQNLLPRTLESVVASILAVALPSLVIVPPALGIVLLLIPAISHLDPAAQNGSMTAVRFAGQVETLFEVQALGFGVALVMNLIAMAVVLLVIGAGRIGRKLAQ